MATAKLFCWFCCCVLQDCGEEEEEQQHQNKPEIFWGGSHLGKVHNLQRDFRAAHDLVVREYFLRGQSLYNEHTHERRFGCSSVRGVSSTDMIHLY